MPSHPNEAGDTHIFVLSPVLKIFARIHPHSAWITRNHAHLETALSQWIFLEEEKRKTGRTSTQLCDQIIYVWVMKFKPIFQHIVMI